MCAASPGMRKCLRRMMIALAVLAMWSTSASAWWDGGHMQIAAIAQVEKLAFVRASLSETSHTERSLR